MVRPIYEPRITPYQPPMLSRSERVPQASDCNPKSLKNIAVMVARARHIRAGYMFYSEAALKARVNLSVAPSMVWASLAQNASHIVWLDMHINHMNMEESRTVSPCKPRLRGKRMEGWEEERKATILSQHSQYSVTRDIECTFHLQNPKGRQNPYQDTERSLDRFLQADGTDQRLCVAVYHIPSRPKEEMGGTQDREWHIIGERRQRRGRGGGQKR